MGATPSRARQMTDRPLPHEGQDTAALPAQASAMLWLYERALAAASTGITIADARQPDMPLIFVNPMFEQMTGYAAPDARGRNCRFLQGPDTNREAIERIRVALRAGEPCRVTLKNYRREGTPFWVDLSLAPVHDEAGQLTHYIGIQTDVTERVRTTRAQRLLADAGALLAESLEYEPALDRVATLAVQRIADWCAIDLITEEGQPHRIALAHADPSTASLAAVLAQYPVAVQFDSSHALLFPTHTEEQLRAGARNPEHLEALLLLQPRSTIIAPLMAYGRLFGALTCVITTPARGQYNAGDVTLIEEIAHRCALALDNASLYRQAREAITARDQFVSIASHELRTPITSAKGYLQLLDRLLRAEPIDRERLRSYAGRIATGIERLEALVSDLLDASRTQQGRLDLIPAPCDLAEIGRMVLSRFEEATERKEIHTLIFDAPQPVPGEWDSGRLDQVLTNLLSNALKYSPDGGTIHLRIHTTPEGGAHVAVSDQGLGIPPEEQRILFTPFMRGAAAQGRISGTGLGLYIVHQIVEEHGGAITVESTPGRGTTFTLTLPPQAPAEL